MPGTEATAAAAQTDTKASAPAVPKEAIKLGAPTDINEAIRLNQTDIVVAFLQSGANANGKVGEKPFLVIALENNNEKLVDALILNGGSFRNCCVNKRFKISKSKRIPSAFIKFSKSYSHIDGSQYWWKSYRTITRLVKTH